MKKIINKYWLELYFAICIVLAILLCHYFGNAFCFKQGMGGNLFNIALVTAGLMFIGGYVNGFFQRLKAKR